MFPHLAAHSLWWMANFVYGERYFPRFVKPVVKVAAPRADNENSGGRAGSEQLPEHEQAVDDKQDVHFTKNKAA